MNLKKILILIFLILAFFISLPALQGSGRDLNYIDNILRFLKLFFPPDFSILPDLFKAFTETLQIAFLATFFSTLLSLPLSFLGTARITHSFFEKINLFILTAIRTIPSLIWALLAVVIFGATPLAGVIALTFYSIGYLGKFFSDAFQSLNLNTALHLKNMGAHPIQTFQYGVWPEIKPLLWSYCLWMFEYNIRSASIIGYVGAGGIGVQLYAYQEYGQWDRFSAVLTFIFIIILVLEWFIRRTRKNMLDQTQRLY